MDRKLTPSQGTKKIGRVWPLCLASREEFDLVWVVVHDVDLFINLCKLTNMSTVPMILQHERPGGRLCRFLPPFRGRENEVRKLSIVSELHSWLRQDNPPPTMRTKDAIRAHLAEFVRGEPVDDLDFMKRVENRRISPPTFTDGVWSVSPRFKPQLRLFGLFAITGWFVILNFQYRDALTTDAAWHAEIDKALGIWAALFPGRHPWVQDNLHEYIPSNAEKRDDRW